MPPQANPIRKARQPITLVSRQISGRGAGSVARRLLAIARRDFSARPWNTNAAPAIILRWRGVSVFGDDRPDHLKVFARGLQRALLGHATPLELAEAT
jgi:hypothetical protein